MPMQISAGGVGGWGGGGGERETKNWSFGYAIPIDFVLILENRVNKTLTNHIVCINLEDTG